MDCNFRVPPEEISKRIQRMQARLQEHCLEALLIIQRIDLFYFSGTAQRGYLYIPQAHKPLLLVKKYLPRALVETAIEEVVEIGSIKEIPRRINDFYGRLPGNMGFEMDVLPVQEFRFYRDLFPDTKCVDGSEFIHEVRKIKSPWELQQMARAAELSSEVFRFVARSLEPGLTFEKFIGQCDVFARQRGHGAMLRTRGIREARDPWWIFHGERNPPWHKSLTLGWPVTIGFCCMLNGYHLDEARLYSLSAWSNFVAEAAKALTHAQDRVLELVRPGITLGDWFRSSLERLQADGAENRHLSFQCNGIGLELEEPPLFLGTTHHRLEAGMTMVLRLTEVLQDFGPIAIRNVFSVTGDGARLISKGPPVFSVR